MGNFQKINKLLHYSQTIKNSCSVEVGIDGM